MKCFKNAIVYVEGKGLVKCNVVFDEKIQIYLIYKAYIVS